MEYDPFDPATHAEPDSAFARLRAECPVHHNADKGFFTIASSSEIAGILRRQPLGNAPAQPAKSERAFETYSRAPGRRHLH